MDKLELQSACFDTIKTLCVNYRKDSSSRKTADYLNKRLSTLENQWKDFHNRHESLVLELEDKNINYFVDNVYKKTQDMYESIKEDIINRLTNIETKIQNVRFDFAGTSTEVDELANDNECIQHLLNKQECNFKAIHRAMSKFTPSNVTEKWELEDHLAILKTKWDPIDKLHWEIDFKLKGSNEHYYEMFDEVEKNYDSIKKKINSKIWSTAHYQKSAPKIELPEFSGNYKQWNSFKDLFLETIHKNPTINSAQKMQHLKTKLRGEAERLVQHLSVSAENYQSCWDILIQRYDNRRLQFTTFMNTMLNLPVIQQPDAFNVKRMHDVIIECLNGISNIGIDTTSWDPIIVHIMSLKLDSKTLSDYMKELEDHREVQQLQDFLSFLENQFMAYETLKSAKKGNYNMSEKTPCNKNNKQTLVKKPSFGFNKTFNYYAVHAKCPHCNGNHVLMNCDKFLELDIAKRNNTVTKLQLCKNCLYSHGNNECKSTKTCKECNSQHHTLLHVDKKTLNLPNRKSYVEQRPTSSTHQPTSNHLYSSDMEILLTTVQLKVKAVDGTYVKLRALLDQGSQTNLITENAAQILRLPRKRINACVTGIGSVSGDCRGQVSLNCKSIHSDYSFNIQALIMNKLTNELPTTSFKKVEWPHLQNLKLADPDFNISRSIDLLLGADVYSEIILDGVLKGNNHSPVAQQTQIGWILCGKMKTFSCHVTLFNYEELTKFWETEDIHTPKDIPKDDHCEKYYRETVKRSQDGKYIVKMPLCPGFEEKLGKSKSTAISQYLSLEKRLSRNQNLATMYKQFIVEYQELGHMKPSASTTHIGNNMSCYLPHHGVLRENSTTTKLRVVFNASQTTSSGYSLNNLMEKGPNLQQDIQSLILKWRTYKYAFTADIEKMYRCIWISEDQQHLQKIIWRNSRDEPLCEFQLSTVTYGTKAAPWLAMRTLKQLAMDDGHEYPDAAKIILTECYVDDVISGHTHSILEAQNLQQSLIKLMRGGGMNLRKWTSNHAALYANLNDNQISTQSSFNFKAEKCSKTLGLGWNPNSDKFHFNWPINHSKIHTKRALLSDISKFYDPLGWLSPITVIAKLLFQKLWISELSWDDEVPSNIENEWLKLKNELHEIRNMTINRWIGDTRQQVELLGFCDASEKAYACVIYSRVVNKQGISTVTLLAAKTRVAPLTQKTTLPRLELCGAILLADMMEKTQKALCEYKLSIQAWSDSQVVLAWIQGDSSKWERYVANRVMKIKRVIPAQKWRYVKSEHNPADCASRGLLPSKLLNYNLWWHGPEFLNTKENIEIVSCSYKTDYGCTNHIERKHNSEVNTHFVTILLNKCNSLKRVVRVIAWMRRFIMNTRNKLKSNTAFLTTSELGAAKISVVIQVQRSQFESEYNQLLINKTVPKKSVIFKLSPYIDEKGVIRVGGRLKNSILPSSMKNPIIVPHTGRYTHLLIEQAHIDTLHGGARLTLTYIRQHYWIVGGNRAVKALIRKCVRCHRFNKTNTHQLMGDLPRPRITPSRPFTHTGVDFSGHVDVKHSKGRGVKTSKGYIAIFVCLATKAVHIELVSDLSTETFLAAFQRLCARRGVPKHMYSDCGTNFIGAAKILRQEYEDFKQILTPTFFDELAKKEVEWHFNAPAWPSAGGLWEAAVKAMKHHLRRVLGEQKLTYEEFSTLLTKIEACLNSRPLCPLTEDPDEFYNCLTPGHFLTGSPILSLPMSDYADINNINLRRRWQLMEHMFHQYWKNWSSEYLSTLQTRSKWNRPTKNIKKGDIVLVKESNLPPGKWALGRVLETHPGSDGYVRVTTIKTQTGIVKRPVVKLAPLPVDSELRDEEHHINKQAGVKQKQRQKTKIPFNSLFLTAMTLFTLVSGSYSAIVTERHTHGAQITRLEHERPVYYDTIGKIQTVHDEWILLMYYNLTNYWDGNRRLETYFDNIKNVCYQTKLQTCMVTMQQLDHEMSLLSHYNSILINPHKHLSNRKKRGLINGVGYVANSLFGILDQQFADKYQQDIQSLQNNEDYMLNLIKNQTTIVELQNEVLRKSEVNIQRQFQLIDSFVNQTNQNMASIKSAMEILSASTYLNSASLTVYLLINSLRSFQETLFNTLTNIYQGHIDVHLITPFHLIEQLSEISSSLPKSVSLPVENYKENIKDMYKLISVKARVTENYFLFEIHIPLVTSEDFTLYRTIPLPVKSNQKATYMQTSSKYIAITLKKNIYISMSEDDFKHCTQQKANTFICEKNLPSYNLYGNNAPCEAKLLSHQTTTPCNVEIAPCKDEWIELYTPNSWLYICCDTCSMRTICNNDVTSHTISSSSIITLMPGCVLQSKDLTIYAHRQYNSRMNMDYELSVPVFDTSINTIVNLTYRYTPEYLQSNDIDLQIAKISNKISEQRQSESQHTTISSHDVHQYIISYFLLASAFIALLVVVGRKLRRHCYTNFTQNMTRRQRQEDIELQDHCHTDNIRAVATQSTSTEPPVELSHRSSQKGTRNIAFNFD